MARDNARGLRIRQAAALRKLSKVQALAATLDVSVAAVSRWQNGGHLSLEHACALARLLDVSLDWLLLGRGTLDWHKEGAVLPAELRWIVALREQPEKIRKLVADFVEPVSADSNFRSSKIG